MSWRAGTGWLWITPALVAAALAGCGDDGDNPPQTPNPASVYCVDNGGTVNIVTAADGSQSGICRLPDGTEIDEWEYYRQAHPDATVPGSSP